MKTADIQQAISENYPLKMTYKTAGRLQIKRGRHRRSLKKVVGFSEDRILSVDLVGSKKSLESYEFMFGLHDPAKAAHAALAIVASIKATVPDWDDEDWLKEMIQNRREGKMGKVSTKAVLMPIGERPFTVMFVKVRR